MKSAHKSNWKTHRNNKKLKQKTKLAFIILSLLILFLGLGKLISVARELQQPFTKESSISNKSYSWNKESNINLVIKGKNIDVLSYNPVKKEVFIIKIPSETYLELPGYLGNWSIASVFDLGQSLKPPQGRSLLENSLSSLLGLPIDGFLEISADSSQNTNELLDIIRKNPLGWLKLLSLVRTNLNIQELITLEFNLYQVRFDKITEFDLKKLNLMEESKLADNTPILIPDPIKIDSISGKLSENNFIDESLNIAIYNATDVIGLAAKAGRLIKNMGGVVIIASNIEEKQQKSFVYISPQDLDKGINKTRTYKRLIQIFGKSDRIAGSEIAASRAQINIILGEDFAKKF